MNRVGRLLIFTLWLAMSCAAPVAITPAHTEITGTQAERVQAITEMLSKQDAPPTPILDAHFVEEQIGDGNMGPSDFRTFVMITVAPERVATWQAALSPLDTQPGYTAPAQPYAWWIGKDRFATMSFYAPDTLTGRTNGWVAIDERTGEIYIFTFTT
jgi:hypothetical protein